MVPTALQSAPPTPRPLHVHLHAHPHPGPVTSTPTPGPPCGRPRDLARSAPTHLPRLAAPPVRCRVAKVPPFLAINPQLFASCDLWSYRDLQKLAKRLELPTSGRREDLIERLREWHRDQRKTGQAGAFHSVEVRASVEGKPISPRLLSPLVVNKTKSGIMSAGGESSPARSPLKATTPRSNVLFSPVRPPPSAPPRAHPLAARG